MKFSDGSDITLQQLVALIQHEIKHHEERKRRLEGCFSELDKEQDLALNKLGQMRASTKQEDIKRALNEGYNDGFKDGFKEGERYRSDV